MSDESAEPFPNFALEDIHRRTWTRADLAGLSFQMGEDCKLDTRKAKSLDEMSRAIRRALPARQAHTIGAT